MQPVVTDVATFRGTSCVGHTGVFYQKADEPQVNRFRLTTPVRPGNHVLDCGPNPPTKRGSSEGDI